MATQQTTVDTKAEQAESHNAGAQDKAGDAGKPGIQAQPRAISNPNDVAQLVLMQVDAVNAKKDELTIAVKGLNRFARADTDHYLLTCSRYIEEHPLRAAMMSSPADRSWASHRYNAFGEPNDLVFPIRAILPWAIPTPRGSGVVATCLTRRSKRKRYRKFERRPTRVGCWETDGFQNNLRRRPGHGLRRVHGEATVNPQDFAGDFKSTKPDPTDPPPSVLRGHKSTTS